VVRLFGQRLGFTPLENEVRSLPASLRHWEPFADTAGALRRLKTRYPLAILSNVDDNLFALTAPKLGVAFDHVITAQQAQAYKPSVAVFQQAQERFGVSPEHWLHVGQSIYHDILPAQSLGLATVWVNRPSSRAGVGPVKAVFGSPDLEVPDLHTLAELVVRSTAGVSD
jgi:2-haloacid dehalogenase